MNAISINYATLGMETMVKIFELADLLKCTPKEAAKTYLLHKAKRVQRGEAA